MEKHIHIIYTLVVWASLPAVYRKKLPGSDIYKCLLCTKILPVHTMNKLWDSYPSPDKKTNSSICRRMGKIFRKLDPRQKLLNGVWVFFPHALHHP